MWLYLSHIITRDTIRVVTSMCSTKLVFTLKAVEIEVVMKLVGVNFDKHALMVNDIDDMVVKYASMMIFYKIFHTNRENFISSTVIHIAFYIVNKGEYIDLCELLRLQLMENLQKMKESRYPFLYGTLFIFLLF